MTNVAGISSHQLKQFIEQIERLEEEKTALAGDIRDVFAEAKASGFDTKTMRSVLKLRKMNADERNEQEELLTLYLNALEIASKVPQTETA